MNQLAQGFHAQGGSSSWGNPAGYKHVHKGASALDHGPGGDRWDSNAGRPGTAAELHRRLSPQSGRDIHVPSDNTSFLVDYERDRERLRVLQQEAHDEARSNLQRKLQEERYTLSPGKAGTFRTTTEAGVDTGVGHATGMEHCPDGHGEQARLVLGC